VLEEIDKFSAGELESHLSSPVESQDIKPYVVAGASISITSRTA